MNLNSLTLTIVIPVYNEQDHIKACLEAIENQFVAPLEVLVVDNNDPSLWIEGRESIEQIKRNNSRLNRN